MSATEIIQNIFYLLGIVGIVFSVFMFFFRPQENNKVNEKLLAQNVTRISDDLSNLRDNHVAHLAADLEKTKTDIQEIKTDIAVIKNTLELRLPLAKKEKEDE